jgi:hypothetical protein
MPEQTYPIKIVGVKYLCECGSEMAYEDGNIMLTVHPPRFKHVCKDCGNTENLLQKYPTVRYERVDE